MIDYSIFIVLENYIKKYRFNLFKRFNLTPRIHHINGAIKIVAVGRTSIPAGRIMVTVIPFASIDAIISSKCLQYGTSPYLFYAVLKYIAEMEFLKTCKQIAREG